MFAAQTAGQAIENASSIAAIDAVMRTIFEALGAVPPLVSETEAQRLAERADEKRDTLRERMNAAPQKLGRALPPWLKKLRVNQRSPNRAASIDRRRRIAYSGPMPPHLAARFTPAQLAVLAIVGNDLAAKGFCDQPVDAIAAKAGVCRRVAQFAIRLAESDGLIAVMERRRKGDRNLTNVITLIGGLGGDWGAWLARGQRTVTTSPSRRESTTKAVAKGGSGCMEGSPTNRLDLYSSKPVPSCTVAGLPNGSGRAERRRFG